MHQIFVRYVQVFFLIGQIDIKLIVRSKKAVQRNTITGGGGRDDHPTYKQTKYNII